MNERYMIYERKMNTEQREGKGKKGRREESEGKRNGDEN